jgi:hypothetical protein
MWSFNNIFFIMAVVFLISIPLIMTIKNRQSAAQTVALE